jgi:hypothetical protein
MRRLTGNPLRGHIERTRAMFSNPVLDHAKQMREMQSAGRAVSGIAESKSALADLKEGLQRMEIKVHGAPRGRRWP